MTDRILQNYRRAILLVTAAILLCSALILAASFGAAEGITWQVTRQTHLTRFHELRLRRLDPRNTRTARKHPARELAEDLQAANQYTAGEKVMRAEILVAFAAGFTAVFGVLFWAFASSPTRRLLAYLGAQPADEDARAAQCLLENLAVRADAAIPNLYVMENDSPAAFALGITPRNSAVAVTRGLLELLDESELEAILAHELSHVVNRDTLPDTIAAAFRLLLRTRQLRPLAGRQASPAREFLADADAVRFTGDAEALGRALRKLAATQSLEDGIVPHAHPALEERMQRLADSSSALAG